MSGAFLAATGGEGSTPGVSTGYSTNPTWTVLTTSVKADNTAIIVGFVILFITTVAMGIALERYRRRREQALLDAATTLAENFKSSPSTMPHTSAQHEEESAEVSLARRLEDQIDEVMRSQVDLYVTHLNETWRQNRVMRWISGISIILGVLLVVFGVAWAMFSTINVGIFSAICGAVPAAIAKLAFNRAEAAERSASENFAVLNKAVSSANRIRQAVSLALKLNSADQREYVLSTIALSMSLGGEPETQESSILEKALSNRPSFSKSSPKRSASNSSANGKSRQGVPAPVHT
ncbi:TRADD-N-associated membrane domain-containing protein [Nocardia blacklockiae]|uniref:TRADD-N-associated membrane domain-containing protein n=1 Tax=Nocardia blacklockiae TaxID=480036 RepID=UPI001896031D|nr:hypothetical protein [Nocardia blacklockiae]MBF6176119.1 hypothetical protein [Nocardia blacklockiae]